MEPAENNKSYSVLTVDDNRDFLFIMDKKLRRAGYHSYTALNAAEALNIAESETIDLALVDYIMPGMDGFSLIELLRESHDFPIIVISSEAENSAQVMGLNVGADAYLPKPFSEEMLLAKISALLRRVVKYSLGLRIPLKNGEIYYNTKNCELTDGKNSIILSRNESILLKILIQNKGKSVTAEELCEELSVLSGKSKNKNNLGTMISRINGRVSENMICDNLISSISRNGYGIL